MSKPSLPERQRKMRERMARRERMVRQAAQGTTIVLPLTVPNSQKVEARQTTAAPHDWRKKELISPRTLARIFDCTEEYARLLIKTHFARVDIGMGQWRLPVREVEKLISRKGGRTPGK